MTAGTHALENLTTLKFERCSNVDMDFVNYLCACPAVKILSMRGSILGFDGFRGPFPINWGQLKVLDLSGTGTSPGLIHNRLFHYLGCTVTHLYMEKCAFISSSVYDHLKIEFLSVAGYRPTAGDAKWSFHAITSWATLGSMKEINASGCVLTIEEREKLIRKHKNVTFNLNVEFEASVRVEF
jgi:hypothetical protein